MEDIIGRRAMLWAVIILVFPTTMAYNKDASNLRLDHNLRQSLSRVIDVGNFTLLNASNSKNYKVMCDGICGATGVELTMLSASSISTSLKVGTNIGDDDICTSTPADSDIGFCNNIYVSSSEFFIEIEAPYMATYNLAELKLEGNIEYVVNAGERTLMDVGDGEYNQRFFIVGHSDRKSLTRFYNVTLTTASGEAGLFIGSEKGQGDMCWGTTGGTAECNGVSTLHPEFYVTVYTLDRQYTGAQLDIRGYDHAITRAGQSDKKSDTKIVRRLPDCDDYDGDCNQGHYQTYYEVTCGSGSHCTNIDVSLTYYTANDDAFAALFVGSQKGQWDICERDGYHETGDVTVECTNLSIGTNPFYVTVGNALAIDSDGYLHDISLYFSNNILALKRLT